MEYPGTKLIKPIRMAILAFFWLLFFLLVPVIILYTSGYRYDFQNGLLKETGSVNVDVVPNTAEVYINNIKVKSKIPIRLNNLAPSKYSVAIKKDGYLDWYKNIEVTSKETVYIKDVVLFKKNTPELMLEGKIEETALSPNSKYLVYSVKQEKYKEIWQNELANNTQYMVGRIENTGPLQILFAPNNHFYSISAVTKDTSLNQILLVNAEKPKKTLDLVNFSTAPIIKFQWKESSFPEIYFATKKQIMTFFPETGSQISIAKNNFVDWYMENGQLWTLAENSSTKKIELLKDTIGFKNLYFSDFETTADTWQILIAKNNFILLKKKNQPEMMLLTNGKKYLLAGDKFLISKYNNWFIAWTPWEIWTKTENEDPLLLNRSGLQLQEIIPLDKYNTLGLVWADNVTILFPYYLVSTEIINQKVNTLVSDSDKRVLYFGGTYNNKEGLWKLEY